MKISAENKNFSELNEAIRNEKDIEIEDCLGQRFLCAGMKDGNVTLKGIPGNALGAYLTGGEIKVFGNAQDAVGDTMNDGKIIIYGNAGDAVGYAMRGGEIFIKGNAGYRAGIHMKAYEEKQPVIMIGGKAGSFLGEYQAGGLIIVLGLTNGSKPTVGNFPCTGMHGGKMIIRGNIDNIEFPKQTTVKKADKKDIDNILPVLERFCSIFGYDFEEVISEDFYVITPDTKNPYKQLYVAN